MGEMQHIKYLLVHWFASRGLQRSRPGTKTVEKLSIALQHSYFCGNLPFMLFCIDFNKKKSFSVKDPNFVETFYLFKTFTSPVHPFQLYLLLEKEESLVLITKLRASGL